MKYADVTPNDKKLLVHGTIVANGTLTQHAWVEIEGKYIFDGVVQRIYTKNGYTEKFQAEPIKTYTPEEADWEFLRKGFHGAWHNVQTG